MPNYEEEIEVLRKSKANTKKLLANIDPAVKKELDARRRMKQLSRSLLPDAPPRKRQKKPSPERVKCRWTASTPSTPPAPKLQPWQIRKQQANAITASEREESEAKDTGDNVEARRDSCGTRHKQCSPREFRRQEAEVRIKISQPPAIARPVTTIETVKMALARKPKKLRPILKGNHFICSGPYKLARCEWCKKCRTSYICKQCGVSLCLEICFEEYHTVP